MRYPSLLAFACVAASLLVAIRPARGQDFPRVSLNAKDASPRMVLQQLAEAAGLKLELEPPVEKELARVADTRTMLNVSQLPLDRAIKLHLRRLEVPSLGWKPEVRGDTVLLRQMPLEKATFSLDLQKPRLPQVFSSGPLKITVQSVALGGDQPQIQLTLDAPEDLEVTSSPPAGFPDVGLLPQIKLRSGKVLEPRGEAHRTEKEFVLWPQFKRDPADPPVALIWDVKWWKR